jgi:phosphate transport system substrate-binding protein
VKRGLLLVVLLTALLPGCGERSVQKVNGTGSTFIGPVMSKWAGEYEKTRGVQVVYEAVGSAAGVQRLTAGVFDFACTDAPLTEKQLEQAREVGGEVLHVPLVAGAVVVAYNLEGVTGPLTLSGPVLANIYLGKITHWNDKAIRDLNPKANLPATEIGVVHRAAGSGTTYIWTDYLAKVSPEWASRAGAGLSVKWPAGVGRDGNQGVADHVKQTPGSVGYLELTYALQKDLPFALVKNREGMAVKPGPESVTAAVQEMLSAIPDDFRTAITNAPGKESYPISGFTWAVIFRKQKPARAKALVDFMRWVTHEGQGYAAELHYAPLPRELVERLDRKLDEVAGH